ncbi:imidazolonepropionase-like amidohydrolase [Leucobacter luti]|uniref:Imidazolonepropionase-like amidohydrolase n=1 Tax=Leucobacter luti TaxID=340320 RepID=A0A4R6RV86_9MICO|nr:amidohydrolase family protein [Leucobacter luti]TDP90860.1 imidazolonepropionase-like amidohydrolase [Leucobacter luti]
MDQKRVSGVPANGLVTTPAGITGVRLLDASGGFTPPSRIAWTDGCFTHATAGPVETAGQRPSELDGTGLWLIPGLVDAHVHAAWHAFDAADRDLPSAIATRRATAHGLAQTLAAGITSVRDAGGLSAPELAQIPAGARPRIQLSVRMLDRAAATVAGGLDRAVDAVLAEGARWVKLVGTAGVAAPAGAGLEPVFTPDEVRDAVRRADRVGAGVMVHAWGGTAIDDAIAAGATSIEHGIFLTPAQATAAAAAGMTLVPTLRIYHLVQRMIVAGTLPAAFRARVDEAVGAHPRAVRLARDAGLPIALGTDSGTPEQHGTARLEFDALVAAGLSPAEALHAATRTGAALLARVAGDAGAEARTVVGTLDPGAVADAVLLRRDPREPGALSDPTAVVRVVLGGTVLDPTELARAAPDPAVHAPYPQTSQPQTPARKDHK